MTPRAVVDAIERDTFVPSGPGDVFSGYGVIGLPFRSGHVLALRRFFASSLGPPYTSISASRPGGPLDVLLDRHARLLVRAVFWRPDLPQRRHADRPRVDDAVDASGAYRT